MVRNSGINCVNDFKDGISACTNTGTTTELNMRDFFNSKNIKYEPIAFEKADEVVLLMMLEDVILILLINLV